MTDSAMTPRPMGWMDRRTYEYTWALTRRGWAWEFLRRNADYGLDWSSVGGSVMAEQAGSKVTVLRLPGDNPQLAKWGLVFR